MFTVLLFYYSILRMDYSIKIRFRIISILIETSRICSIHPPSRFNAFVIHSVILDFLLFDVLVSNKTAIE